MLEIIEMVSIDSLSFNYHLGKKIKKTIVAMHASMAVIIELKLSRNKKDLNDITAAPFLVLFCCRQLRKRQS